MGEPSRVGSLVTLETVTDTPVLGQGWITLENVSCDPGTGSEIIVTLETVDL